MTLITTIKYILFPILISYVITPMV